MSELLLEISSIFTMVGVVFIGWQIFLTKNQERTNFEDLMAKEYREIIREIPADILLGAKPEGDIPSEIRELIFNYIDLSNQQVFLRQENRISNNTWFYWCAGIAHNLKLPVFNKVWEEIKTKSEHNFTELRRLEEGFTTDPKDW